jgi:hypothetical protein
MQGIRNDLGQAYRCAWNCLTVWWLDHRDRLQMSARVIDTSRPPG